MYRRVPRSFGGYNTVVRVLRLRTLSAVAALVAVPVLGGCIGVNQPLPEPAATAITNACNDLAVAVQPYGVNTLALTTTCTAAVDGQGSQLLQTFLASPQLGCIALAGPVTALGRRLSAR